MSELALWFRRTKSIQVMHGDDLTSPDKNIVHDNLPLRKGFAVWSQIETLGDTRPVKLDNID